MGKPTKDQQIAKLTRELNQAQDELHRQGQELSALRVNFAKLENAAMEDSPAEQMRKHLSCVVYPKEQSDRFEWADICCTIRQLQQDFNDVAKALKTLAESEGVGIDAQMEPVQIVEALAEKVPAWVNADADLATLDPDWVAWVREGHGDLSGTGDVAKLTVICEELLGPQGLRYVLASSDDPLPSLRRWVRKVA